MVRKRRLYVFMAAILVTAGAASYALADHGGNDGRGNVPETTDFKATLSALQEVPAISSTGFGSFRARLDDKADVPTIHFVFEYGGLEGGNSLFAHVHFGQRSVSGGVSYFLCGPPANAPVVCPNVAGTIEGDITAANVIGPNGQGIEPGSFDEIVRAMRAGDAYANIHTTRWPGGEIRGQINDDNDGHDDR
jgi:hypothetical protein